MSDSDTPHSRSNRRQFLTGQAAADALADLADRGAGAGVPLPAAGGSAGSYLVEVGRSAMACRFEVLLSAGRYPQGTTAALAALDVVDRLESQMTVYRDSSEIMAINATAADEAVPVEPGLFDLLELSLGLHADTGGAFDITSGPLSKVWGFYRRQGVVPTADDLATARGRVGSQYVQLNSSDQTIRFLRSGLELNLGSIGKGYALDRCAAVMREAGVEDFIWHGGNSSILAHGSRRAATDSTGWVVGVADPLRPQRRLAQIRLIDRAMGTSGAAHQFFRHGGRRYGHILDPRTGWPSKGVLSSTVTAPSAAVADALATSFYVMGPDAALEYCGRHPEIGMLMVCAVSSGGSRILNAGLGPEELTMLTN